MRDCSAHMLIQCSVTCVGFRHVLKKTLSTWLTILIYPIYQERFDGLTFKVSCIVVWFYMQLTCIYFLHMVQCRCCWLQMPCCPQRRTTFFLQMFMRKNRKRKAETAVTKPSSKSAKLDSVSSQSSTSSSSKDWSTDRWPTVLSGASGLIHLIQMWWNLESCVRW